MSAIEQPQSRMRQIDASRMAPRRPRIETMCLLFLSFGAAVALLHYAQAILLPFILSLLIFYALDPIVSWISRSGVPRVVGGLLLMAVLFGAAVSAIYLLREQASDMVQRLPEALSKARAAIESHGDGGQGAIAKVQKAAGELEQTASEAAAGKVASYFSGSGSTGPGADVASMRSRETSNRAKRRSRIPKRGSVGNRIPPLSRQYS